MQRPHAIIRHRNQAWGEKIPMPDEFCASCGRQGRPHDRFCRGCGAALSDDASAAGPIDEAEALVARGLLGEAIAAVQRAIGAGDSADLHVALATLYLRRADIDAATRELDAAVALDPSHAVAHAYSGALLLRRGHVDEAEAALDRARDLAPDDLIVAMKRAEFFNALGILGRARDELQYGLVEGGGAYETRVAAARMLADVERRLARSITRRTVRLPDLGAVGRLVRRAPHQTQNVTAELEA